MDQYGPIVTKYSPNVAGVSNLPPAGHMRLRMVMNETQHKIVNLLEMLWDFFVIMCHNVFNVRPKQLFFFQCGPEMPKIWTPLHGAFTENWHWSYSAVLYLAQAFMWQREALCWPRISPSPLGVFTGCSLLQGLPQPLLFGLDELPLAPRCRSHAIGGMCHLSSSLCCG